MPASVLIIDDNEELCLAVDRLLGPQGYRVRRAGTGEEGLALCGQETPDLVLLDLHLPGIDGIETLRRIRKMGLSCRVVVITAYETARSAMEAAKLGAEDYITKPVPMEELRALVARLVDPSAGEDLPRGQGPDEIVGDSPAMAHVFEMIRRVSRTAATVLITGESGTGKELVARAIHRNSGRVDQPFMSVNCASIPANLLESELFGHEKGAFTDAGSRKLGLVEVGGSGSLLLDEIGSMSMDLQAKILTLLETRRFRRVGGTEELSADVRFIAATNRDLNEAIQEGGFREDLYYRLNVIPIRLPPLRERGGDILLLAKHFLNGHCRRHGVPPKALSADAEGLVTSCAWPGNVRELKNVLERAVLLTDGPLVEASDLSLDRHPQGRRSGDRPVEVSDAGVVRISFPPWGLALEDLERQVIEEALRHTKGNISKAARLLHLGLYALRYRMQKHGLGPAKEPPKP